MLTLVIVHILFSTQWSLSNTAHPCFTPVCSIMSNYANSLRFSIPFFCVFHHLFTTIFTFLFFFQIHFIRPNKVPPSRSLFLGPTWNLSVYRHSSTVQKLIHSAFTYNWTRGQIDCSPRHFPALVCTFHASLFVAFLHHKSSLTCFKPVHFRLLLALSLFSFLAMAVHEAIYGLPFFFYWIVRILRCAHIFLTWEVFCPRYDCPCFVPVRLIVASNIHICSWVLPVSFHYCS